MCIQKLTLCWNCRHSDVYFKRDSIILFFFNNRFSAEIDDILEDDEIGFSDQLKEYLFFSDVLK